MMDSDVTADFAALAPWVFRFRIGDADYGGKVSAIDDSRIKHFFRFAPEAHTILELGSLEGAHVFELARHPHVTRVLGIEGRAANLRKAQLVQKLLRAKNTEFVEANLEECDLTPFGKFDAVFCSGLLYHLPEPWKLIARLPAVAPKLFLWTHYAAEAEAEPMGDNLRGKIQGEGGADEPLSGLSSISRWLTLGSLINVLTIHGYESIHIIEHDLKNGNGPAVTLSAAQSPDVAGKVVEF
ncbi:MAG: class I SAM-dependent methyltransferase [Verrucomicrobiota bacterium]